eukprot:SAG31_NODE_8890_length_1367_cov_1.694006_1_plen_352_part_01
MLAPVLACAFAVPSYDASVSSFERTPVLSYLGGSSTYQQSFNPSWVQASAGTSWKAGLLVRSQNCTAAVGVDTKCNFAPCALGGACQDVITFAELLNNDNDTSTAPRFKRLEARDVVLSPRLTPTADDNRGVQDPRIAYDPKTGLYHMYYTCYNTGKGGHVPYFLCLAVSRNPTDASSWIVRKEVFPKVQGSKSGALMIRHDLGKHFLFWGAGVISVATSVNLTEWPSVGEPLIKSTAWGNPHVESGPPPLRLSDGNYVFFHNSWTGNSSCCDKFGGAGYEPAWVILSGMDPTKILARAQVPLWTPQSYKGVTWMTGQPPSLRNVGNVAFLEAAHPTDKKDEFRVYFGGSDT